MKNKIIVSDRSKIERVEIGQMVELNGSPCMVVYVDVTYALIDLSDGYCFEYDDNESEFQTTVLKLGVTPIFKATIESEKQ